MRGALVSNRLWPVYTFLLALAVLVGAALRGAADKSFAHNFVSLYPPYSVGYDVSWPNCQAKAHVAKNAPWGVVGITGGLVLHENKCAADEYTWFKTSSLYVNTGYAGQAIARGHAVWPKHCVKAETCMAYDFGYQAGHYAVQLARRQHLATRVWWLDVETVNSWADNVMVNRASLQGMADAIKHETIFGQVGYYAYPGQWDKLTGKWRNGAPAWVATGNTTFAAAAWACTQPGFTGGPVIMAQYTKTLDRNYVCPADPVAAQNVASPLGPAAAAARVFE